MMAKYTDEQIKQALELCTHWEVGTCERCPLWGDANCIRQIMDATFDLINRQEAEIERLQTIINDGDETCHNCHSKYAQKIEKATSEAIKEVAEKVIDLIYEADDVNPINEWQVRNLVKEMGGEGE